MFSYSSITSNVHRCLYVKCVKGMSLKVFTTSSHQNLNTHRMLTIFRISDKEKRKGILKVENVLWRLSARGAGGDGGRGGQVFFNITFWPIATLMIIRLRSRGFSAPNGRAPNSLQQEELISQEKVISSSTPITIMISVITTIIIIIIKTNLINVIIHTNIPIEIYKTS